MLKATARFSALALMALALAGPVHAQSAAQYQAWLQLKGYGKCELLKKKVRQCVGETLDDPKKWSRLTLRLPDETGKLRQQYSKIVVQEQGNGSWDRNERFGVALNGQTVVEPVWQEILPLAHGRVLATADVIKPKTYVDKRTWNVIDLKTGAVTPAPHVNGPQVGYSDTHLFVVGSGYRVIDADGGVSLPMPTPQRGNYWLGYHGSLIVLHFDAGYAGRDATRAYVFDRFGVPVLQGQDVAYNPTYKRLAVVSGPAPNVTGGASPVWTLLDGEGRPMEQPFPKAIGMVTLTDKPNMMLMGGKPDGFLIPPPIVPMLGAYKVGDAIQYGEWQGPNYDTIEMRVDPHSPGFTIPLARRVADKSWVFLDRVAAWKTVYTADEAFAQGLAERSAAWKQLAARAQTPEGQREINMERFKVALANAKSASSSVPQGANPREFNAWAAPFRTIADLGAKLGGSYAEQAAAFPYVTSDLATAVCRDAAHACMDARSKAASIARIEAQVMGAPALTAAEQQAAYISALNQDRSVLGTGFIDQVMRNNEAQRQENCTAAYAGANRICYPR